MLALPRRKSSIQARSCAITYKPLDCLPMKFRAEMMCLLFVLSICRFIFPQSGATSDHKEPDRGPAATFITSSDIQQAIADAPPSGTKDAALRVVPVENDYNIGISVVRRARINGRTVPDALQHHSITEVYHVLEGCGALTTGGTLVEAKELPTDDPDVLTLIGPTAEGTAIRGGNTRQIKAGDVVIIPPNTAHGCSEICSQGISYILVRMDGGRVLRPR